jgi:hypothetical protein
MTVQLVLSKEETVFPKKKKEEEYNSFMFFKCKITPSYFMNTESNVTWEDLQGLSFLITEE